MPSLGTSLGGAGRRAQGVRVTRDVKRASEGRTYVYLLAVAVAAAGYILSTLQLHKSPLPSRARATSRRLLIRH
jgi:hypothetical protein